MKPESGPQNPLTNENITYASKYGSIMELEGIMYAISQDGELQTPIPRAMAERISLVMRLQDKANEAQDEDTLAVLQTFNCRKSALIVGGVLDVEASIVDMGADSGEEAMFADVERLLADQYGTLAALTEYRKFESELDAYDGTFPCMVHIFESDAPITTDEFSDQVEQLHRLHSFIVLGEDEDGYVCFHKTGPATNEPFAITSLEFVTNAYSNEKDRTGYFVFGPSK